MIRLKSVLAIVIACSVMNAPAFADTEQENIDLARINNILNAVYPLINEAQKEADPNARVQFHYDWLQSDIQQIQQGIAEKINQQYLQPRAINPLSTQFVYQQNVISS